MSPTGRLWRDRRVIITGGLGFIGSNLAIRLVELGAKVTIIDSKLLGCGANPFNIEPVRSEITLIEADLAEPDTYRLALRGADVIFNLAGEISHIHSMQFPERDLQINTLAQLRFLLACSEEARGTRVVYASTRQIYGIPRYAPVDEGHPMHPVDYNGVHKLAATQYHLMLSRSGLLDAVVLKLTNIYGPRMALDVSCQGFLGTFVRRAVLRQQIEVFGDGRQVRDPVFVDDAVTAFLLAGISPSHTARSFNIGGSQPLTLAAIADIAAATGDAPEPVFRPFPSDRKTFDIGSYQSDSRRFIREYGWEPRVCFTEGFRRTVEYYRSCLAWYLNAAEPDPPCRMPEHNTGAGRLAWIARRAASGQ